MMKNYFLGTPEQPFHLSIGAVVLNEKNEVCCHYFKEVPKHLHGAEFRDIYILMRETMEQGESIQETLHRGLREEFGVWGDMVAYLGSLHSTFIRANEMVEIQKTTLYFLVRPTEIDHTKRGSGDEEDKSKILWLPIDELSRRMKDQWSRYNISHLHEEEILERAKPLAK